MPEVGAGLMLAVYGSAALICVGSIVAGRGVLVALGRREWTWLSAPVGLAALVVLAQPLVRLPGRGATAAVLIGVVLLAALALGWLRRPPADRARDLLAEALPPALIVLFLASIPFIVNGRVGVLGEGVYTNDHAAQLFWAEWLATGFGPEPRGIEFGYPLGPQSLAAVVAEGTGASLETAFNGLLLAIPVLTAVAAVAVLRELPPVRRTIAASLVGLPYLAASFLAQSAFKETAMALFVVGFAIALSELRPSGAGAESRRAAAATLVSLGLLALAGVLTFSLAGLVWPLGAAAIWLGIEVVSGRISVSVSRTAAALRPLWPALVAGLAVLAVIAVAQGGATSSFLERLGDIQSTTGRLFSSVSPREALGVWPEGDFRVDASGDAAALIATLVGLAGAAFAAWWWARRRDLAIPATLAAAVIVYAGARVLGGIHVEAKALAVMAPVAMLFVLRALLARRDAGPASVAVGTLAVAFVLGAAGSTFLALRAAPVGTEQRAGELEELRDRVAGEPVLLLVADRFGPYRLREAKVGSPGGYVPSRGVSARPGKRWDQGRALEFDSVTHRVLNGYRYVITSNAAYGSAPPPEFERVDSTPSYTLWRRERQAPARGVIEPPEEPGAVLACGKTDSGLGGAPGTAAVFAQPPVLGARSRWLPGSSFELGESASQTLDLDPGQWEISLQYHSPVGLELEAPGLREELPASLDGMFGFAPGEGQFWPAGSIEIDRRGPVRFTVRSLDLPWAGRALGAERTSWLGAIALTRADGARDVALRDACDRYVDRYRVEG